MTVLPRASAAQTLGSQPASDARFSSGPLEWTPRLEVREAGLDSNVFRSADNPKEDWFATIQPQIDTKLTLGIGEVEVTGIGELVHFQRYTSERAMNGRFNSRAELALARFRPFGGANVSVAKDRANSEIDLRARRYQRGFTGGVTANLSSRTSLEIAGNRQTNLFYPEATYRGIDLAPKLNVVTTEASAQFRIDLTPLTAVIVDARAGQDEFTLRPGGTENLRGNVGIRFAPDAVIRGRATVGYHRMTPVQTDDELGHTGWQAAADLSYTLLARTRFDVRMNRQTSYSALANRPFYVSTGGSLNILQTLVGPIDLLLQGSLEQLAYAATAILPSRVDRYELWGGGVSFRAGSTMRIGLNYSQERRVAPLVTESFERRRIYTSFAYGL